MNRYRQALVTGMLMCVMALIAAVVAWASPPTRASATDRSTPKPAKVGTLIMVSGVIRDQHPGARRAIRVKAHAVIERGDVISPAQGASARIVFVKRAKAMKGTLFTLKAPTAATQQIRPGATKLGPRLAFAHQGRDIATVVGPGLDALTKITAVTSVGTGAVRVTFRAPTDKGSPFACSVDHSAFIACHSPEILRLKPGNHTIAVRSTSLYGFHGPAVSRHFNVAH